jgi:serine/threonine-protein kinase
MNKYEIAAFLGEGSIGRVFRAFDPGQRRSVALKMLRDDDADSIERLLHEATAQACVNHDHVCKIYETGRINGKAYIAMQFIEGITLTDAAGLLSNEQKARVMKQVAEAIHEAHRAGLIHRDIKPSNIMLEKAGDSYKPYVLDFGLVRQIRSERLTSAGELSGTPAYMAPEEARGDDLHIDRRTDIYGLGATMYYLFTGKPQFEGSTELDVLLKVMQDDPAPLRSIDSSIPAELEIITMKCLEKDPHFRYDSAQDLAADLQRYLDREPIQARPAGFVYRLRKNVRKNKLAFTILSLVLLVAAIVGVLLLLTWRNAARQARLGQQFGQEAKEIEGIIRYSHMLPLHDVRDERRFVQDRIQLMQEEIREIGTSSEGPGHYAIGRLYLALNELDLAKEHLEKAWNHSYRTPETAYALGQALGQEYMYALQEIMRSGTRQTREKRKEEIAKLYRDPALNYLNAGKESKSVTRLYVEGLISFYEGRYKEAVNKAQVAIQQVPWLYEAKKLEGDAYVQIGKEHQLENRFEEALSVWEKANEAYETGISMARSDSSMYESECGLWTEIMYLSTRFGKLPDESLQNALASCGKALTAYPDNAGALNKLSRAYFTQVYYMMSVGGDPSEALDRAVSAGERAIRKNSREPIYYKDLAEILYYKATEELNHGLDAGPSINRGIEYAEKARSMSPEMSKPYNTLGTMYELQGQWELSRGKDPRASFKRSIQNFESAIEGRATHIPVFNAGSVYLQKGQYELMIGSDPSASFERAVDYCKTALQINPELALAWFVRAQAYRGAAEFNMEKDKDPSVELVLARAAIDESLKLPPTSFQKNREVAAINLTYAKWLMQTGLPPVLRLEEGIQSIAKSAELNPGSAEVYLTWGELYLWLARWSFIQNESPAEHIRKGIEATARARWINPALAEALAIEGELELLTFQSSTNPTIRNQAALKAAENLTNALEMNPILKRKYGSSLDVLRSGEL